MDNSNLMKLMWTENDFEQMGWHDNRLYAVAFGIRENEIIFDIDYILKWIDPKGNETNFNFIVVPATLVFRNAYDLNMNFSSVTITIENIYRDNPNKPKNASYIIEQIEYDWTMETTSGEMTFKSVGYKQYARQSPKILDRQFIGLTERGGISFDLIPQNWLKDK